MHNIIPRYTIYVSDIRIRPAYKCTPWMFHGNVVILCPGHVCVLVNFTLFQTINDAIYDGRKNDWCIILLQHTYKRLYIGTGRLNFGQGNCALCVSITYGKSLKSNKQYVKRKRPVLFSRRPSAVCCSQLTAVYTTYYGSIILNTSLVGISILMFK